MVRAKVGLGKVKIVGLSRDWLDARLPFPFYDAGDNPGAASWLDKALGGVGLVAFDAPRRSGYLVAVKADAAVNHGTVALLGEHPQALGVSLLSATGASAEWAYDKLAGEVWAGSVSVNRADVALDFMCSQRRFDALFKVGVSICRDYGKRPHPVGDTAFGRTLYFNYAGPRAGIAASVNAKAPLYSARLYEKGKETGQDPEWRRFELICRPDKPDLKLRAFGLSSSQLLGAVSWSRAMASEIGYLPGVAGRSSAFVEALPDHDDARAARAMWTLSHMGEQYGSAARELERLVGRDQARALVEAALFADDGGKSLSDIRKVALSKYSGIYAERLRQKDFN